MMMMIMIIPTAVMGVNEDRDRNKSVLGSDCKMFMPSHRNLELWNLACALHDKEKAGETITTRAALEDTINEAK